MSAAVLDLQAVRARFSSLQRPFAFFDGPAGTQVPDQVIDAIADYLRDSNANTGGAFMTSRRTDEVIREARAVAARFLVCTPEEAIFGPSMTNLNFNLTRTVGRELSEGDEIVVTRLDHDANVAPWLELARDLNLIVRFADYDLSDLEAQLSARTKVVAFPWASNALGTVVDAELRVQGVDGLRVADASVIPVVPRGNTNAAAIMIGERAADLLQGAAPVRAGDGAETLSATG